MSEREHQAFRRALSKRTLSSPLVRGATDLAVVGRVGLIPAVRGCGVGCHLYLIAMMLGTSDPSLAGWRGWWEWLVR